MTRQGLWGTLLFVMVFSMRLAIAHDEPSDHTPVAPSEKKETHKVAKSGVVADTKPDPAKAKKLYDLFNKSYIKTIAQIQCLKDLECINSEDDVLKYSIYNVKLLLKLEELVDKKDLWAMYYRGLISFERGTDYADRAGLIRDRDFIFTAMVLNRKRDEQYAEARKFFKEPAKARFPEACQAMGNIYAHGYGTPINREQAMDFYYCAAIEYLAANRSLEAQIVLKDMSETGTPTDARTVDIYAKVNKNIR